MAISSVKTSSVVNGFPKDRSLLAGNLTSATPSGYLAVSLGGSPNVSVYRWYDGFGRKYSDPASLPSGSGSALGVRWSRNGNDIVIAQNSSSIVTIYSWNNLNGFGAKHTSFSLSAVSDAEFSPGDTNVAFSSTLTPFIHAYPFTSGIGVGTKYANPSTLPVGTSYSIHWSPSGNSIATTNIPSPYINVYAWSSGFGTKYANPATLPTGAGWDLSWSPSGNDIAVTHSNSPYFSVYPWSNISGFGTKYANPATTPTGTGNSTAWAPSGETLAITHSVSPYISVYPFTSGTGFGTKYANPESLFNGSLYTAKWHSSGNAILFNCNGPSYIGAYSWSNGFQKKHDDIIDKILSYSNSIDLK
jgi:hypothetical protein